MTQSGRHGGHGEIIVLFSKLLYGWHLTIFGIVRRGHGG
jgi:hypothetical protein